MRQSIHAAAYLLLVVRGAAPATPENPWIVPDFDATCSCGLAPILSCSSGIRHA